MSDSIKTKRIIPENKGNLVTRRAFLQRDGVNLERVPILAEVTRKTGAMAYKMTEETGLFGSGRRSPLHIVCDLITKLVELEDYTAAREMAAYPRLFLAKLEADQAGSDAIGRLSQLLKCVSDANFLLKGRNVEDLPLGDLKEFSELITSAWSAASDLGLVIDALLSAKELTQRGAPIHRENRLREASGS